MHAHGTCRYDPLVQARSGTIANQHRLNDPAISGNAPAGGGSAQLVNSIIHDKTTGMTAVQAVLAALYAKKAGHAGGQHIRVSMLDVGLAFNWIDVQSTFHYFVPGAGAAAGAGRVVQSPRTVTETFGLHTCRDGSVTEVSSPSLRLFSPLLPLTFVMPGGPALLPADLPPVRRALRPEPARPSGLRREIRHDCAAQRALLGAGGRGEARHRGAFGGRARWGV